MPTYGSTQLTRQRPTADIGPIGIVRPVAAEQEAANWRSAAQEIGRLRGRYFSDVMADIAEDDANMISELQLRAEESWNNQFLHYLDQPDGEAQYTRFMENQQAAMVAGLPERLRDEANLVLGRMRVGNSFAMKKDAYQEAERQERIANGIAGDQAVLDFEMMMNQVILENEADPATIGQIGMESMQPFLEGLDGEYKLSAEIQMNRSLNRWIQNASAEARDLAEARAESSFNQMMDSNQTNIASLIRQGANMQEVAFEVDAMHAAYLGRVGSLYDTVDEAESAFNARAIMIGATVLGREAAALASAGRTAEAQSLILEYQLGNPVGIPNFGGFETGSNEMQMVVNLAGSMMNRATSIYNEEHPSGSSSSYTLEQRQALESAQIMARENPDALLDAMASGEFSLATNRGLDSQVAVDLYNLAKERIGLRNIVANIANGGELGRPATIEFRQLSSEDQKIALTLWEKAQGLTGDELYNNPDAVNRALAFQRQSLIPLPGFNNFLNSINSFNMETGTPEELVLLVEAYRQAKGIGGNVFDSAVAGASSIYEGIDRLASGTLRGDALLTALEAVNRRNASITDEMLDRETEEYLAIPEEGGNPQILRDASDYIARSEYDSTFLAGSIRWLRNLASDSTSTELPAGQLRLLNRADSPEVPPEIYTGAQAWDAGIFDSIGNLVDGVSRELGAVGIPTLFGSGIDIALPQPNTEAYVHLSEIYERLRQERPHDTKEARARQALAELVDPASGYGYGITLFSMYNTGKAAFTQNPFEQHIINNGGTVGVALAEIALSATAWERANGNLDFDFQDALEDGNISMEWDPSQQGHIIYYRENGRVRPLFTNGRGAHAYVYHDTMEGLFSTLGVDTARSMGIESDFLGSALAAITRDYMRSEFESVVTSSQEIQAVRRWFAGEDSSRFAEDEVRNSPNVPPVPMTDMSWQENN